MGGHRRVFWGILGYGGRTRQQTCVEKHLTAAYCLYIYLASEAFAPDPTRAPPLDPAEGLDPCAHPDFRACLRHLFQLISFCYLVHRMVSFERECECVRVCACAIIEY